MSPARQCVLALFVVLSAAGAARHVLPTTVLVRVVDATSQRPLPNAEVSATGAAAAPLRRLTDANGELRLDWPESGTLAIRVRQLGFRYADRTVTRGSSATATEDTVVVSLARAPFALPPVATRVNRRCTAPPDPAVAALSAFSLDLLQFGAEQFTNFITAYPFEVTLDRRTEQRPGPNDPPIVNDVRELSQSESWGQLYVPRDIVRRTRDRGFAVRILFVSSLADSTFWDRHCFVARGVELHEGRRTIRLDFSPARGVRDVDWEGTAWIDSTASLLTRVDFRLANLLYDDPVRRFEGYTIFSSPSPGIALPDSTVAWWWRRSNPGSSGTPENAEVRQIITVARLRFLGAAPPPATGKAP